MNTISMNSNSNDCIPALRKPKCMTAERSKDWSHLSLLGKENQNEKVEVLDPKMMEFPRLVELLHPKFISDYMERILNFLTQNNNEMSFPDIAPYKAAFLERIVSNPSNLKMDCFNEPLKVTASKIMDVLEKNKSVFKWTYLYETGKADKSVLVYKKQYVSNDRHESDKSGHSTFKNKSEVPAEFKKFWLNRTLAFTKDDTQHTLEFANMPNVYADFIKSIIWKPGHEAGDQELKGLCGPLWEAMKIFSLKYEFWLTSQKVDCENVSLLLAKVPKIDKTKNLTTEPMKKSNNTTQPITPASDSLTPNIYTMHKKYESTQHTDKLDVKQSLFLKPVDRLATVGAKQETKVFSPPPCRPPQEPQLQTNLTKKGRKNQKLIYSLPAEFLARVLREFTEFLEDKQQASILFKDATPWEADFLQRMYSVVKSSSYMDLFPDEYRGLLKRMQKVFGSNSNMYLDVILPKKKSKKSTLRDVIIQKAFKVGAMKTLGPPKQLPLENAKVSAVNKDYSKNDPDNPFLRALSVSSDSLACKSINSSKATTKNRGSSVESQPSRTDSISISVSQGSNKDRVVKANEKIREPSVSSRGSVDSKIKSKITFASAGQLEPTDHSIPSNQSGQSSDRSRSRDRLSKAKQKMLEALSVPVQCGKAERMMMLMGWQGGALGLRGEGITEPILPALQIKAGAGFGHLPPDKPSKQKEATTDNRSVFIEDILRLIRSKEKEIRRQYDQANPLTNKYWKFMNSFVKNCNKRKVFDKVKEKDVPRARSVLEQLVGTPIAFTIMKEAAANEQLTIILKKIVDETLETKPIQEKKEKKKKKDKKENVEETPPHSTEQREEDYKIKVNFLKKLLTFVKGDSDSFQINITEKHPHNNYFYKNYFINVVAMANKSKAIVYNRMEDYDLYKELVESVKGFYLEVDTEQCEQLFTFTKRFRKRFINSSLVPTHKLQHNVTLEANNDSNEENLPNDPKDTSLPDSLEDEIDDSEDNEETEKSDLKLEVYEDDWMNCCDSNSGTQELDSDRSEKNITEANNNYMIKLEDVVDNVIALDLNDSKENAKKVVDKDYKTVCIVPKEYPNEELNSETVIRLQNALIDSLKIEVSLPKLQCLGYQNGGLIYRCRNENTYLFLTDFVEKANFNLKLIEIPNNYPKSYCLEFKINSFIQNNISETFLNFELYNNGLKTLNWEVLNVSVKANCLITKVSVDIDSYKYICDSCLCLDLGFDKALFRLVW